MKQIRVPTGNFSIIDISDDDVVDIDEIMKELEETHGIVIVFPNVVLGEKIYNEIWGRLYSLKIRFSMPKFYPKAIIIPNGRFNIFDSFDHYLEKTSKESIWHFLYGGYDDRCEFP